MTGIILNIIIAILCVLIGIAYWEWPRSVWIVGVTYPYNRQYTVLGIFKNQKDAEKHTKLVLTNRINDMDHTELIILCHDLGFDGIGKQPIELLREMVFVEIKNPAKYLTALVYHHIHTPERKPIR